MKLYPFRTKTPKRTYTGKDKHYSKHKAQLANDFNDRCGYTDCPAKFVGGKSNFQIDHFKPQITHAALRDKYDNLVYCHHIPNRLKSAGDGYYLDPCDEDYNLHFVRNEDGAVFCISTQAEEMYKKLNLYALRYGLIWSLEQVYEKMKLLKAKIEASTDIEQTQMLKIVLGEVAIVFMNCFDALMDS